MSTDARARRPDDGLQGQVDFTMMYASHDAFARDLRRLGRAAEQGQRTGALQEQWRTFRHQLHVHHTAEDEALWPPLRAAAQLPGEVAVLDAMEREHAAIDPGLDRVDEALQAGDTDAFGREIALLTAGLADHMAHEERSALPLVERHLGREGWARFGGHIRTTQGVRGAATFLPWLLDEAPDDLRRKVLGMLPPPVRLLYRLVWQPRYRRTRSSRAA